MNLRARLEHYRDMAALRRRPSIVATTLFAVTQLHARGQIRTHTGRQIRTHTGRQIPGCEHCEVAWPCKTAATIIEGLR